MRAGVTLGVESVPDGLAQGLRLYTLAVLNGVILVVVGLLGAGRLVAFVPTAVMTGFVTAVRVTHGNSRALARRASVC